MQITLIDYTGTSSVTTYVYDGAISISYDHIWDKSGREPELIAHFDGDLWVDAATGYTFTDLIIGEIT